MSRVSRNVQNPKDPLSITEHLSRLQRVVDGDIEFGDPSSPSDPTSTARADGASHNGNIQNVRGSWVEILVTATGRTTHTCTHNLNCQAISAATPNVRWLVFGIFHDGTGSAVNSELRLTVFWLAGAVTADSIILEVSLSTAGVAPTINADHPVKVTLFFTRAVRA